MQFLYKYRKKYGKQFGIAVLFVTIEAACDLLQPTLMASIIDVGVAGRQIDYVLEQGGLMMMVTVIGAGAAAVRNIVASRVSQNIGADLRSQLYRAAQTMPCTALDQIDKASLVTRITNDVTQVQSFVNGFMRLSLKAPLLCIGGLVMAVSLNVQLAVVLAVLVPVIIMLIVINMKKGFPLFFKVQVTLDRMNGALREYLSGIRVVKAFNRFDYEQHKFSHVNDALAADSVDAMRMMAAFGPSVLLVLHLGIVAVLWLGGMGVGSGQIQVGQVIAFINYMMQILFSLMVISMVFNMFVRARASADRIEEVLDLQSTIQTPKKSCLALVKNKLPAAGGSISFCNVGFSYHGQARSVLQNINFFCTSGQMVGIVGATGAGKTSLVNLIPRFYEADEGEIKINGQKITELDVRALREKISIVPQATVLFTGSILENIRWGKKTATLDEVMTAAKMAQAHEFIMEFPEAYQTRVGQNGINLSGGQKQRIAIARALVRNPDILILDDCTSAVDMETERKIKQALKQYAAHCTCITIAQRMTSVMDADLIIVLEDGVIADCGRHGELIGKCTVYQEICHSQLSEGCI